MGHRRTISPGAIAIANEARQFAACLRELQTPYGDCNSAWLQVLARTLDPPRKIARDRKVDVGS